LSADGAEAFGTEKGHIAGDYDYYLSRTEKWRCRFETLVRTMSKQFQKLICGIFVPSNF
jgi:hypothetical protein